MGTEQNQGPGATDGRKYSLNDMVRTGCDGCRGCSACCQGMGSSIVLNPKDVYHLTGGLGMSFQELMTDKIELQVADGIILPNLRMDGETERCVFLNAQGRCTIHDFRPDICRIFPLGRSYEEDKIYYIYLVNGCKKPGRTKVKVRKWIDVQDAEKDEEFLIKWHNFRKAARDAARKGAGVHDSLEQAKAVSMNVLKRFYLMPYDTDRDFYRQFDERLKTGYEELE